MTQQDHRRDRGIVLIAAFKMFKALLLFAIGLSAIGLIHGGIAETSRRLLATFSSGTDRRITESMLSRIAGMSPHRIEALGIGAFLYGALFFVEAIGLWLRRRWAEYLTVISTASFIPFEIYELVRDVTPTRIGALVINIAMLVYLVVRLRRKPANA